MKWWGACQGEEERLEDCSGGVLGNLLQDPVGEEYGEGNEEEDAYYTEEDQEPA